MAEAWKILAKIGPADGKPRRQEYFLVAISDKSAAVATLCSHRPDLLNADVAVVGETGASFGWLDMKDGQVLSIMVVVE
jgi:hypothetical protein